MPAHDRTRGKEGREYEPQRTFLWLILYAIHNAHNPRCQIKKLIFITPTEGATKLETRYGQAVRALAGQQHSIAVEICGI